MTLEAHLFEALLALCHEHPGSKHYPKGCWCDASLGNPMYPNHTRACHMAQTAVARYIEPPQKTWPEIPVTPHNLVLQVELTDEQKNALMSWATFRLTPDQVKIVEEK